MKQGYFLTETKMLPLKNLFSLFSSLTDNSSTSPCLLLPKKGSYSFAIISTGTKPLSRLHLGEATVLSAEFGNGWVHILDLSCCLLGCVDQVTKLVTMMGYPMADVEAVSYTLCHAQQSIL